MKSPFPIWTISLLAVCFLTACSSGGAQGYRPTSANEQLSFGVQMAQRGLWSEALFRFEQAQKLEPGNGRAVNNLAVAHEALGNFDEALKYYQDAISRDPGNQQLKKNYANFLDFYQAFKPDADENADG